MACHTMSRDIPQLSQKFQVVPLLHFLNQARRTEGQRWRASGWATVYILWTHLNMPTLRVQLYDMNATKERCVIRDMCVVYSSKCCLLIVISSFVYLSVFLSFFCDCCQCHCYLSLFLMQTKWYPTTISHRTPHWSQYKIPHERTDKVGEWVVCPLALIILIRKKQVESARRNECLTVNVLSVVGFRCCYGDCRCCLLL